MCTPYSSFRTGGHSRPHRFFPAALHQVCAVFPLVHDMETRAEKLCPCLIGFDNIVYPKETLHKARLTALHAICVQIFRHIAQKSLARHTSACGISDNLPKNLTTHLTHKLYAVFP
ncbi:hypothetical protein RUMCAL_01783 [Ruminococcus callidus ATCC 27760]|uniref:Uncharacterized protein n=1 Tax=Ruminococcus callidus ATCC 27760 TaxID=411473 RepID=U2K8V4_9FIRM|nr:hypothetical protein RUMCAL_01783 [Ruminococcus callidus ATCC 27760]